MGRDGLGDKTSSGAEFRSPALGAALTPDDRPHAVTPPRETILVTGFGPFPGAPVNPTEALMQRLARLPRGALGRTHLVTHVFPVSYRAVDRDLPALLARHRPLALVMFGLAARTSWLRLEMRARNAIGRSLRDADGRYNRAAYIAADRGEALAFPNTARALLQPLRVAGLPVRLSRNAGSYLCNYLSWRAIEHSEARGPDAPAFAIFIHVPLIANATRPTAARSRSKRQSISHAALTRAMPALLRQAIVLARREALRRERACAR